MFADSGRLHIAVQKSGRLAEQSRDLLAAAGLRIQNGKPGLTAAVDNFPIDLMFVRDDDIPTFVADGVCELGIAGRNVIEEFALERPEAELEIVAELGFGRCALKIAAPEKVSYSGPEALAGARIATSYPRLLKRFLDQKGVAATIVRMKGAVELAPRLGIAGFVCDLVSTGATLEANGLAAAETVLESEALLLATRRPIANGRGEIAGNLRRRIAGVIATQESKYIMLNAPAAALAEIAAILPGAEAPTIIPLAGAEGHVAVHAVCKESVFWETLDRLKGAGASAILVMPIEKMMI